MRNNYKEFEYISISKVLKESPSSYVKAYLYTETDEGDLSYFIDHQLGIVNRAIEELFNHLEKKRKNYLDTMMWLAETDLVGKLNSKEVILLQKAIKNPGKEFRIKEVCNYLGVSENTARNYLKTLVNHKLFICIKLGRETIYIARQDIVKLVNQKK